MKLKTYTETVNWLFSQLPVFQRDGAKAYKANLDTTLKLDHYFGHPHQAYKTVHIAGTNGKGSTSHMLTSILMEAGYKVGLYTSPHLKDFSERIQINGQAVPQEYVVSFVNDHYKVIEQLCPSFFEITVALAFQYFKDAKVDIAVIETGMGGRLDSTNIIKPVFNLITNISIDHACFLGNTLADIAREKAGIIKQETPVLIGRKQKETDPVFQSVTKEKHAPLLFAEDEFTAEARPSTEGTLNVELKANKKKESIIICSPLQGTYQTENIRTAYAAGCELIKLQIIKSERDIISGIEQTQTNCPIRGRWEIISENPYTICDTGHNKDGVQQLCNQLRNTKHRSLHIVWGMAADKDADEIISILPKQAQYYLCAADMPRSMAVSVLANHFTSHKLKHSCHSSTLKALEAAKGNFNDGDIIFIGGSTFVVAELL